MCVWAGENRGSTRHAKTITCFSRPIFPSLSPPPLNPAHANVTMMFPLPLQVAPSMEAVFHVPPVSLKSLERLPTVFAPYAPAPAPAPKAAVPSPGTVPGASLRTLSWNEKRDLVEDVLRLDADDVTGVLALLYQHGAHVVETEPGALQQGLGLAVPPEAARISVLACVDLDRTPNGVLHVLRHYVNRCVTTEPPRVTAGDCGVCRGRWVADRPVRCGKSGCLNAVHPSCFGGAVLQDTHTPWLCWDCTAEAAGVAEPPSESEFLDDALHMFGIPASASLPRRSCIVCCRSGSAMKKTDGGAWVHVPCALFTPGVCALELLCVCV